MPNSYKGALLRQLLSHQLISDEDVEKAQQNRKQYHSMPETLVAENIVSAENLVLFVSQRFGVSRFDISQFDIATIPDDVKNEKLVSKHQVLPVAKKGRTLFLATSDPTDVSAQEDFEFNTGLQTEFVVCEPGPLAEMIHKAFSSLEEGLGVDESDMLELADLETESIDSNQDNADEDGSDDAPIVVYINKILMDAIRKGASDLHFEPYEKEYRIRFRVDGILTEVAKPPTALAGRLSARIKVISNLDIAEKRKPQDGRIKLKISAKKSIDFRVSTLPTIWGEKVVMRILDSSSAMLGIDVLGYEEEQKRLYMEALEQPQGMILVTGPTGSGKTVSLYTGLNILNTPERNISTAEDPVEINLSGINQVQMNVKAGLDFASALKAFLRQDPDIIMVGEIRDLETAEISIKAAQTGHLVLSTLHTNSAPETLTRLANMGVPAYNIASSVSLIIAQRLARRLCSKCKEPETDLPEVELLKEGFTEEQINTMTLFKPIGCNDCTNGYKGRVGIYEVLKLSERMRTIIMEGGNSLDIAKQAAAEGMNDLRKSGLIKAASGMTSLSEVNRVTNS
ncbi:type IV-A pilus assembly ATPase PilB [Psychrosphaera haliotis]|uniref:Type IV-A pilus assembly ATPase PilB n=1 Tax=Psychrosphaera haliotis TaxID=555083 RepID=A0A6N8F8V9_9GAMM|nr:type IV-A pilus assembly ATPase PilB [Psychrosphaera haliotis]MUH73025.1 type IV-A pilus assembly ATPase PilB [Psychrosphaera haliotis]